MKRFFDSILDVSVPDPDDARRRRLLNILLLGNTLAAVFALLVTVVSNLVSQISFDIPDTRLIISGVLVATLGFMGIYQLNRRVSGRWAALLYLLLLTLIFTFTDSPHEVANGRALLLFTLPVAMASLILASQASFLFAGISSLIIWGLARSINEPVNSFAIIGFFMLALVAWLSTRSL